MGGEINSDKWVDMGRNEMSKMVETIGMGRNGNIYTCWDCLYLGMGGGGVGRQV